VIVSNVGTKTGVAHLFATDATTGPTSGTVYRTDRAPTGAGTWVNLAQTSVSLAPGASTTVPFTVQVPTGAPPGQWVAGIAAEGPSTSSTRTTGKQRSVRIRVRSLTIVAVQVNVPGAARQGFRIGAVHAGGSGGYQQVFVHFSDTGNVLSRPRGTVTVAKTDGSHRQPLRYSMDTFVPMTAIDYPLLLRAALPAGAYNADILLRARPLDGGSWIVVRARRRFTISSKQVKQVFTTASPTKAPSSGDSSTTIAAAGGGAAVALLVVGGAALVLRRRPGRAS
jgi:MYXO-CTERM domain-containing protein